MTALDYPLEVLEDLGSRGSGTQGRKIISKGVTFR